MRSSVQYAKQAEELLIKVEDSRGLSNLQDLLIAQAQVYATLAQAAATKEMKDSVILASSPSAGW